MSVTEAQAGGRCGVERVSHGGVAARGAALLGYAVAGRLGVRVRGRGQGSGDQGGKALGRRRLQ